MNPFAVVQSLGKKTPFLQRNYDVLYIQNVLFTVAEVNICQLVCAVHNYQVEVYTRDEPNAATDANVSITVEGLRGDTGKRKLLVSQNGSKFQPGQASD